MDPQLLAHYLFHDEIPRPVGGFLISKLILTHMILRLYIKPKQITDMSLCCTIHAITRDTHTVRV